MNMAHTPPHGNRRIDAQRVKDAAQERAEELAVELLGQPSSRPAKALRFGNRGSLVVHLAGPRAGRWRDHEAGQGGDMLDLWAVHALNLDSARADFPAVLSSLAARLGIAGEEAPAQREERAQRAAQRVEAARSQAEEDAAQRAAVVAAVRAVSRPVRGTPGWHYLQSRALSQRPPSAVVQYHGPDKLAAAEGLAAPSAAALVVFATDASGKVVAGQRILVDDSGQKVATDGPGKPTFGVMGESAVRLPATGTDSALYVCEGPETALTIWEATGAEVWAVLGAGRFAVVPLPTDRRVILCPDQDAPGSPAALAFAKAAAHHAKAGAEVWIARAPEAAGSKRDLNDTHRRAGLDAVRAALGAAVRHDPARIGPRPVRALSLSDDRLAAQEAARTETAPRLRATIAGWTRRHAGTAAARRALSARYAEIAARTDLPEEDRERAQRAAQRRARRDEKVSRGLDALPSTRRYRAAQEASAPIPGMIHDRIAVTGSQGLGKTAALVGGHGESGALHDAAGAVSLMLLPTMGKVEEAAEDYRRNAPEGEAHPVAMVLRGRGQPDPEDTEGRAMCWVPEAAEAAAQRGANVRRDMCMGCPFREACGYMRQEAKAEAMRAEERGAVVFATHAYLTLPLPARLTPDLVVVDEAPSGMVETVTLDPEALRAPLPVPPLRGMGKTAAEIADRAAGLEAGLAHAQRITEAVLMGLSMGRVLAHLRALGIGSTDLAAAIGTLTDLQDTAVAAAMGAHGARQGAAPEEMDSAIRGDLDSAAAPVAARLRVMLEAVRVEVEAPHDAATAVLLRDGKVMAWRAKPLQHPAAPLLYLDGTANMAVAQRRLGRMAEYRFEVPRRAVVTQVRDRTFSDSSITGAGRTGEWADYAQRTRDSLRDLIASRPGALVVGTKPVLGALGLADLDCQTANYGALRGVNAYADCSCAIVIGRARPGPRVFEDEARAYAAQEGREIVPASDYQSTPETIRDATGRAYGVEVQRHPDPLAEAFRRERVEAEIEQAVDRLRLIHGESVREVILLNAYPTVTPDRVLTWAELQEGGTLADHVEAQRFLPLSAHEAARCLPRLFRDLTAARRGMAALAGQEGRLNGFPLPPHLAFAGVDSGPGESRADPIKTLYRVCPTFQDRAGLVEYRAKAPRSRAQRALVWDVLPEDAEAHVAAHVGPLASFRLIEVPAVPLSEEERGEEWTVEGPAHDPAPPPAPPSAVVWLADVVRRQFPDAPQDDVARLAATVAPLVEMQGRWARLTGSPPRPG